MKLIKKIFNFYVEGFRSMTIGKTLWLLIAIKLFVMFFILKLFFFPNFLNSHFKNPQDKANYVREQLIK